MATSGKGIDNGSITARLVDLISNMPIQAQKILLTRLEEKLRIDERKYPRKPYLKEVEFATEDRVYQEFIQDISTGGLFIETPSSLAVGQEIILILSLPSHERPIKIICEVVRATQQGIGVKFKPSSPIIEEMIETLVEKI
jgi:Tfp pilus assembly protein PilZ